MKENIKALSILTGMFCKTNFFFSLCSSQPHESGVWRQKSWAFLNALFSLYPCAHSKQRLWENDWHLSLFYACPLFLCAFIRNLNNNGGYTPVSLNPISFAWAQCTLTTTFGSAVPLYSNPQTSAGPISLWVRAINVNAGATNWPGWITSAFVGMFFDSSVPR